MPAVAMRLKRLAQPKVANCQDPAIPLYGARSEERPKTGRARSEMHELRAGSAFLFNESGFPFHSHAPGQNIFLYVRSILGQLQLIPMRGFNTSQVPCDAPHSRYAHTFNRRRHARGWTWSADEMPALPPVCFAKLDL